MKVDELPFSELLSDVVDNRGKTCPTAEKGIPLIATNCIRNELLYPTYEKARYVSQETYDTWFRGHPRPGDILFVNKATPGRVCLVPDPVDFCIAQDMVAIRADEKKVYPKFLFAVLRSPAVQSQIEQMHVGTLIPHFKKGDFDKLLLQIPERKVQEFIGDLYFTLSAKIELNRRMNETLEALAQTLFKSWFVPAGRSLGEGGDATQSALPKGWRETTLGEVAENASNTFDFSEVSDVVFVNTGDVLCGDFLHSNRSSKIGLPGQAKKAIRRNDILFSEIRPGNRRYAYVDFDPVDYVVSTKFMVVRAFETIEPRILYQLLTSAEALKEFQIEAESRSGTFPQITFDSIKRFKITLPPIEFQRRFVSQVTPLDERIKANKEESRTLAALRDALLPKLLSGELRVPAELVETTA
ncbi:MAG TPA: restriction endonuclease subunit S [Verrucomicrobiae bacterium]|nr:restriction endonuclease subunit S [Verrucomicrobiae bacterium]